MGPKENGTKYAFPGSDCSGSLTKREHFAAMAMQALLSNRAIIEESHQGTMKWAAEHAVEHADALLRALAAGGEG